MSSIDFFKKNSEKMTEATVIQPNRVFTIKKK